MQYKAVVRPRPMSQVYKGNRRFLLTWGLLMVAMASVVYGITDVLWGLDFSLVFLIALVALTLQWALASLPIPQWLAAACGGVFGVEYVLIRVGQLEDLVLISFRTIFAEVGQIVAWLWGDLLALLAWFGQWQWQEGLIFPGTPVWSPPPNWMLFPATLLNIWSELGVILLRGWHWLVNMLNDTLIFDPIAASVVWGLVIWILASWAGWSTRRYHNPLLGIVPSGVTLSSVISYTGADVLSLLPLLLCSLILIAMTKHWARELHWLDVEMDFARDLWSNLLLIVTAISVGLVILSAMAPEEPLFTKIADWIDERRSPPSGEVAESLGLEQQPQTPEAASVQPVGLVGLPEEHAVGPGPTLQRRAVMAISTGDLAPLMGEEMMDFQAPVYRWRGFTYDTYTGSGWVTTNTQEVAYDAGFQLIDSETITQHHTVRQTVRRLGNGGNIVYVAGTLVAVDQDYRVSWRSIGDFFGATADVLSYRADSYTPLFTEVDLRETSTEYPDTVQTRYLQLPDSIPERVSDLAEEITADMPTAYDRARAIESYMRTFTYTLEVPAPPEGREVADFFLFDLQQGYCDYYATSMVVLARAVGLPARIVMGYIGGAYDAFDARYIVYETDSHSWVEIYFPGYGWIEFEPTSGRPAIERISGSDEDVLLDTLNPDWRPFTPETSEPEREFVLKLPILIGLAVIGLLISAVLAFTLMDAIFLLLRKDTKAIVTRLHHRLRRWARRLRAPLSEGDTPHELATAMSERLTGLISGRYAGALLRPADAEIHTIMDVYVQVWYAPRPVEADARRAAVWAWWKLRWRLWFAWPWRKSRRQETSPEQAGRLRLREAT